MASDPHHKLVACDNELTKWATLTFGDIKEVNLADINRTCTVLIPKCNEPKHMSEFRPISCCNALYKIISKTMANKLKLFLNDIISVNQSAFVPGRLITDNALIVFENFHSMKRKGDGKDG